MVKSNVGAGLKVYEMSLDTPTGDIVVEPAMSETECAKAMAYGMMAVEPGIDALALGERGYQQLRGIRDMVRAALR